MVSQAIVIQSTHQIVRRTGVESNMTTVIKMPSLLARHFLFFLFLMVSWTTIGTRAQSPASEDQPFASITYTAVVRGKVALPCDITPPSSEDTVALILWYKDDALTPIYTLDSRKGYLDQARTLSASVLDGRAYFNSNNRPAFLHIDPIRLTDAGDYRCRVDFKKARTVNTVISLKVIVPPEEPVITDVDGNELKGLVGPYNEGDPLRLLCTSAGGQPRPTLAWWRDYTVVDDTYEYNEKDVAMNQLTIPSLARHHLLSIFTCQAVNNNITVPASSSITLDLNLKPTDVKITQLSKVLVADTEAMLECTTFGSRPKALIYWSFDGQRMTTPLTAGSLGEHQTSTTITITPRQEHNGAEVTCTAENPKIPGSGISDIIKLDVQSAPKLSLQLGSPAISLHKIQEGNDIYFDCHIISNPRPNKPIVWKRNGNILLPGPGVIQSNQSLVLQRVSKEQKGAYQCEASNVRGTTVSNTIHLKIRFAPVCIDETIVYTYGVSLHENVQLPCLVEANPPQVSFSWKFQGTLDLTSFIQTNDTSSTLTYAPHAPQEYGSIECRGKNDVGLQQKSCKYQIIPAGPPKFSYNCQSVDQSYDSLSVQCIYDSSRDSNNSWNPHHLFPAKWQDMTHVFVHPRTFHICEVYHLRSSHLLANVTAISPDQSISLDRSHLSRKTKPGDGQLFFYISNLPTETTLRLRLFAQNNKGRSESIWIRAQTLKLPERMFEGQDDMRSDPSSTGRSDVDSASLMANVISFVIGAMAFILFSVIAACLVLLKFGKGKPSAYSHLMGLKSGRCPLPEVINDQTSAPDMIPAFGASPIALPSSSALIKNTVSGQSPTPSSIHAIDKASSSTSGLGMECPPPDMIPSFAARKYSSSSSSTSTSSSASDHRINYL